MFTRNRKDAIIESFSLDPRSFHPVYKENGRQISVTVPKKASESEALGFIRYDRSIGQVMLTNACAQLEPESLQLGQTTKRGKSQLIGCHGEGLKLAAMVMSREDYCVSMETNNAHWSFCLGDSSQFRCTVTRSSNAVPKRKPNPGRDMARFVSRIWRDVTVIIGPGERPGNQGVSVEQFKKWLDVSMEIRGFSYPESIIETDYGDLILDFRYRGKVFLKGLLLPSSISEPRAFTVGYNLVQGDVNRDRQRLVNRRQEANRLRKIWESAILKNEGLVLPIYVNLLWYLPRSPDVELAEDFLESSTRLLIWKHLLKMADGRKFYFCQTGGSMVSYKPVNLQRLLAEPIQCVDIITSFLNRQPVGLPQTLWNLLRGSVSIRTADEERVHMFRKATTSRLPDTWFGHTVLRALRASLALFSYPTHIRIVHSDSEIQMVIDLERRTIRVDQHFFDINKVHVGSCRPGARLLANGPFLCDHVVEELFATAQDGLSKYIPSILTQERRRLEMRAIKAAIRLMPRDITLHAGTMSGTFLVTWEDGETGSFSDRYGQNIVYHIVLHEERCTPVMSQLLHVDTGEPDAD